MARGQGRQAEQSACGRDVGLFEEFHQPLKRNRTVSKALRAYAQSVSSADKGGVRMID